MADSIKVQGLLDLSNKSRCKGGNKLSPKALHIYVKILHISHVFKIVHAFFLQLLVIGGRKAGNLFKLIG